MATDGILKHTESICVIEVVAYLSLGVPCLKVLNLLAYIRITPVKKSQNSQPVDMSQTHSTVVKDPPQG